MKSLLIYYLLVVTVLHSSIAYSTNALNCQHKDQNSRYNKVLILNNSPYFSKN